uniref:Uncharacterized protein n=1 Tax=Anguilla anguilla TaxID=7936 RepID=A0A0E9QJ61_ANGAN
MPPESLPLGYSWQFSGGNH